MEKHGNLPPAPAARALPTEDKAMAQPIVKADPPDVKLRPWALPDAEALVRLADDREIWLNLRGPFPHPVTIPTAEMWLADHVAAPSPRSGFAVLAGGAVAGGVSLRQREDEHRICSDLTFWVGRPFWGKGIGTAAVRIATAYAFDTLGLERVQAFVFDWNEASSRVLERCGYTFEGRLRRYVLKDGRYGDALLYSRLRSDP